MGDSQNASPPSFNPANVKTSLKDTLEALNSCIETESHFLRSYGLWKDVRKNSLFYLEELAESLDDIKQKCNVYKTVGAVAGIAGGTAAVTGAILLRVASGGLAFAPLLASTGGAVGMIGGFTNAGAAHFENSTERRKAQKAKCILIKDRVESEKIYGWIEEQTQKLNNAIMPIMEFDELKQVIKNFIPIYKEIKYHLLELTNSKTEATKKTTEVIAGILQLEDDARHLHTEQDHTIRRIINSLFIPRSRTAQLTMLIKILLQYSDCWKLFEDLIVFYQKHTWLFEIISSFAKLNVNGPDLACNESVINAWTALGPLMTRNVAIVTTAARQFAMRTFLFSISVAIDAANLVSTSRDLISGSKSHLSVLIRQWAASMRNELEFMENIL